MATGVDPQDVLDPRPRRSQLKLPFQLASRSSLKSELSALLSESLSQHQLGIVFIISINTGAKGFKLSFHFRIIGRTSSCYETPFCPKIAFASAPTCKGSASYQHLISRKTNSSSSKRISTEESTWRRGVCKGNSIGWPGKSGSSTLD